MSRGWAVRRREGVPDIAAVNWVEEIPRPRLGERKTEARRLSIRGGAGGGVGVGDEGGPFQAVSSSSVDISRQHVMGAVVSLCGRGGRAEQRARWG